MRRRRGSTSTWLLATTWARVRCSTCPSTTLQVTVQVEVVGHPMDQSTWSSPGRPGPHPAWEEASTVLTVRRPQLALLKVREATKHSSKVWEI